MVELQDIFRLHGADYRQTRLLSPTQSKAMKDILTCRTAAQGAHINLCADCGSEQIAYNSCRNRHCPKCQTFAKEIWIDKQHENLLNCRYFHVVLTVPAELRPIFLHNQEKMYRLLFKAVSETLMELCSNKKYLGAKPGITAVMHTWGQNLSYHPHLHCLVTGGGLTELGAWKDSRRKFFLPVKVLSKKFRGKFLHFLRQEKLQFQGSLGSLNNTENHDMFFNELYQKDWIVYCKAPFADAQKVIDYLGRYTHRVAISNNRIVELDKGNVSFRWRDYSDGNRQKTMTISAIEFIRRFLNHILPHGFRKIRHFGIFAPRDKTKKLTLCKRLTDTRLALEMSKESTLEKLKRILGEFFNLCPLCKADRLARASP